MLMFPKQNLTKQAQIYFVSNVILQTYVTVFGHASHRIISNFRMLSILQNQTGTRNTCSIRADILRDRFRIMHSQLTSQEKKI